MLAGVIFNQSQANREKTIPHFVNQYILTDLYISSHENNFLRTPILPSIATLVNPSYSLVVILYRIFRSVLLVLLSHFPGSHQAIKRISVANTGVYYHDGRALATCESGPPIRIKLPELETVGWFDGNSVAEELGTTSKPKREDGFGGTGLLSFMKEWTTGHPKVDPRTGEMILFHCNFTAPYVHYSVIPPIRSPSSENGLQKLLNAPVPGCSGGKMMHDFGVSPRHTVILDLPLSLTPFNLLKNKPVVCYEPEKPARFGVFPRRNPDNIRWFETTGCCIFHTANTWDEYDRNGKVIAVKMLACRLKSASLVFSAGNLTPPTYPKKHENTGPRPISFFAKYDDDEVADVEKFHPNEKTPLLTVKDVAKDEPATSIPPMSEDDEEQCRLYYYQFPLDNCEHSITHQYALSSIPFEFPTVNPAYEMLPARYVYGCSTSNESFGAALGKATKIDVLVKIDVRTLLERGESYPPKSNTGCVDTRGVAEILGSKDANDPIRAFKMPPNYYAQEARFLSRNNPTSEDDGYLLFYAFDESQLDNSGACTPDAVSELWIIDARNMTDIIAKVRLPQRVPYGLHGNWFTKEQIASQRPVSRPRSLPTPSKETWSKTLKSSIISVLG